MAPDPLFPGRAHPEYAATLTSHRASITASLGAQLADVNSSLRDLQERRLKARRELTRLKAGASAARAASEEAEAAPAPIAGVSGTLGLAAPSSAQAQMYDEEASALIKTLEADLAAVEAAERKLTEIAQLQTTLVQHLAEQADMTSHLQTEALGHSAEVNRGNQQLEKAKAANRSATKMLSVFLIGSGLGLLFLHCEYTWFVSCARVSTDVVASSHRDGLSLIHHSSALQPHLPPLSAYNTSSRICSPDLRISRIRMTDRDKIAIEYGVVRAVT